MPAFDESLGRLGMLAGGTAGAAGGGLLGQLLGSLDYPRKALWSVPQRVQAGDWLGTLPALGGAAAGIGSAFIPGVAPYAGLIGAGVGGALEGGEEAARPDMQEAPSPSDLMKMLGGDPNTLPGMAGSMALGMAGDPLMYAGGLGGGMLGEQAGEAGGRYLNEAATARGPNYPGGTEKLLRLIGPEGFNPTSDAAATIRSMAASPQAAGLMGEVHPQSTVVGRGMEALQLRDPDTGAVLALSGDPTQWRIGAGDNAAAELRGRTEAAAGIPPTQRADVPEMLPTVRRRVSGHLAAEHAPFVDIADMEAPMHIRALGAPQSPTDWTPMDPGQALLQNQIAGAAPALEQAVKDQGLIPTDIHDQNLARLASGPNAGHFIVSDRSSIRGMPARPEPIPGEAPKGWLLNKLLDLMGADEAVRGDIQAGVAQGGAPAGVSPQRIVDIMSRPDMQQYMPAGQTPQSLLDLLTQQAPMADPAEVQRLRGIESTNVAARQAARQAAARLGAQAAADPAAIRQAFEALPWDEQENHLRELIRRAGMGNAAARGRLETVLGDPAAAQEMLMRGTPGFNAPVGGPASSGDILDLTSSGAGEAAGLRGGDSGGLMGSMANEPAGQPPGQVSELMRGLGLNSSVAADAKDLARTAALTERDLNALIAQEGTIPAGPQRDAIRQQSLQLGRQFGDMREQLNNMVGPFHGADVLGAARQEIAAGGEAAESGWQGRPGGPAPMTDMPDAPRTGGPPPAAPPSSALLDQLEQTGQSFEPRGTGSPVGAGTDLGPAAAGRAELQQEAVREEMAAEIARQQSVVAAMRDAGHPGANDAAWQMEQLYGRLEREVGPEEAGRLIQKMGGPFEPDSGMPQMRVPPEGFGTAPINQRFVDTSQPRTRPPFGDRTARNRPPR